MVWSTLMGLGKRMDREMVRSMVILTEMMRAAQRAIWLECS